MFEAVGFEQDDVTENDAAGPVGDNPSGVEQDRARAELEHHFEVMGGDQLGARQALDKLNEPPATARVEVGGRFIEHEYGRLAGQHTGETDPFALAETQVMRRAFGLSPQLDPIQAIEGDSPSLGRVFPQVERPERNIFDDRVAKELIVRILKNQADPPRRTSGALRSS